MNAHTPTPDTATPAAAGSLDLIDLAGQITAAYVTKNAVPAGDLPRLIQTVHGGLHSLAHAPRAPKVERPTEAEIRASIRPETIVSFEDGKPYRALRRHLTLRGLTPETYRRKWGLPVDYPMVAAEYSARRSEISRAIGLGQRPDGPLGQQAAATDLDARDAA